MNAGDGDRPRSRILLVDDEPELLLVTGRLLTGLGYDVATASSGEKALGMVEASPPDLVILDMVMPGMDGETTLRRIRELAPDQKVIILSGFAEPEQVKAVRKLGILAYIRKPFDLGSMSSAIRAALAGEATPEN